MGQCSMGAQDSNSFRACLNSGFIPENNKVTLTYEGVFNEHYYPLQQQQKNLEKKDDPLLSLETSFAITNDFLSLKKEQNQMWAGCIIKSNRDGQPRNEIPVDISVVLDISGSMSASISSGGDTKLSLAKQAIATLFQNSIKQTDSFGLALFNTSGFVLQEITQMSEINKENFLEKLEKVNISGGTTLTAGLQTGIDMYKQAQNPDSVKNQKRQKRIIFITDMEDMQGGEMDELIKKAGQKDIYVSIIGVGISFNSALADSVIKNEGCNYFSITKEEEMRQIVVDHFDYNFFPCAFNVDLQMDTTEFEIDQVYGTPLETKVTKDLKDGHNFQSITEINTAFPSALNGNLMKGGLILMKLKKKNKDVNFGKLKFQISYASPEDKMNKQVQNSELDIHQINENEQQGMDIIYSNGVIKKGIILQQYVEITNNCIAQKAFYEGQQFLVDEMKQYLVNIKDHCEQYEKEDDIHKTTEAFQQLVEIIDKNQKNNQKNAELNQNLEQ